MKWPKRILITLTLLLAIAVALPLFISLDDYIPQIENAASARLKEPVSIKSIRFAALPLPHVTVKGVTIGATGDIRLGTVRVTPDVFSLLKSAKVIKTVEVDTLILTQKAIATIPTWSKPDAEKPPQVRIENIRLNDVRVNFGKASLGPFDVRVSLDSKGEPLDASVTTQDGKLKAFVKHAQSNDLIDASAKAWTLPVGAAIVFDELSIKGTAKLDAVNLSQISARLYGGTANGKASLSWRKGLRFHADLDIKQVEMQKIAFLLSPKTRVSGKLSAKPVLSASAASADRLMNALRLETPFNVQDGAIHGVDIQKTASVLIKQGSTGGETRFDHLSGHLAMEHGSYHFTQLKIASSALAVDGNVNISPKKALSGRINAQVKAVGSSASVPLNVAGTLDAPLLYPTAGTIAGAAVGTAILGPGLGTSLGARAEGLFGRKKEEKPKK